MEYSVIWYEWTGGNQNKLKGKKKGKREKEKSLLKMLWDDQFYMIIYVYKINKT